MVEQGNIISEASIRYPLLVVSKNTYNQSGCAIVCPITETNASDLGYQIDLNGHSAFVQCDNLRMLNLSQRSWRHLSDIRTVQLVNVLSRINSIFDIY